MPIRVAAPEWTYRVRAMLGARLAIARHLTDAEDEVENQGFGLEIASRPAGEYREPEHGYLRTTLTVEVPGAAGWTTRFLSRGDTNPDAREAARSVARLLHP